MNSIVFPVQAFDNISHSHSFVFFYRISEVYQVDITCCPGVRAYPQSEAVCFSGHVEVVEHCVSLYAVPVL